MERWWKIAFFVSIICWLAACKPPEVEVTATSAALSASVPPTRTIAPTITMTGTATSAALSASVPPSPPPTALPTLVPTETSTAVPTATPSLWASVSDERLNSATGLSFEVVNQIGGEITAVEVKSDVAFLGIGPRLVALDVTDPSRPQVMGQSDVLPGVVQDFVLVGELAFVTTGENGFWVIDISNPHTPQVVSFKPQSAKAQQIAYQDAHLFVLGMKEGEALENELVIYSIANPENVVEINRLTLPFRYFYGDMILEDESIYLVDNYSEKLYVVDIAQLEQPLLMNTIAVTDNVAKTLSNKTLYTLENGELHIFDISDSQRTVEIAQIDNLIEDYWQIEKMMVRENLLFVSAWYCDQIPCGATLFVFNISEPGQAKEIAPLVLDSGLVDTHVINDRLYAATISQLLITKRPEWHQLGHLRDYITYGAIDRLTVADERLYVVNSFGRGIGIFSLEQPTQPVKAGAYTGAFDEITAGNNQIYPSAGWGEGLHQVDVQHPGLPKRISIWGEDDSVDGPPVLETGRLYALLNGYLAVLDVTDPGKMILLNDLAPSPQGYGPHRYISVSDNIVYALGHQGIYLLDASDPTAVVEIGFIPEEDDMCALTAGDGYVFVYSATPYCSQYDVEGSHLTIYDTSNLAAIQVVGRLEINSPVETMLLKDDNLYLVGGDLRVVDISQPDSPQIIGSFPTPGQAHAVAAFADLIYVADGAGGLLVLRPLE
ncbi:MAG: hypothetical protein KJ063_24980 [Anaerolineae bacterium]|nr:hypothetical protein [Anaerolineae bacterium]